VEFSSRTAQDDTPNRLADASAHARRTASRGGRPLLDLTVGNPTAADLPYPAEAILDALADPRALRYEPHPLGLESAREAVARSYEARGLPLPAARVAITASTSEAYATLFKILADPGDQILVPSPSYPLLGFLAAFESVELVPYPLAYAGRWHVDLDGLRAAVGPRTRAIVVVNPNNPTGSYLGVEELDAMLDTGLPIVSDEVFSTYSLTDDAGRAPEGRVASVLGTAGDRGLVFALSGLSKLAALPQMKLGWIGVAGETRRAELAMKRLELVLDAYLSVSTPVQLALPTLLETGRDVEGAIRARTRKNLATLRREVAGSPATVLDVEGGWYAVLRVPETRTDEEWALALLEEDAVHVQPGYFFDMDRGAHLVISLLCPEAPFAEGAARIATRVAGVA